MEPGATRSYYCTYSETSTQSIKLTTIKILQLPDSDRPGGLKGSGGLMISTLVWGPPIPAAPALQRSVQRGGRADHRPPAAASPPRPINSRLTRPNRACPDTISPVLCDTRAAVIKQRSCGRRGPPAVTSAVNTPASPSSPREDLWQGTVLGTEGPRGRRRGESRRPTRADTGGNRGEGEIAGAGI